MKQMNRKTVLLITAVLGVVVLVGVLLVLYFTVWAQPSKQDFQAAKDKGIKISSYSGSELSRAFTQKVSTGYDEGVKQQALVERATPEKKKVTDALDSRAKLAEELGESAVMRDDEVKKLYDAYYAKEQKYATYFRNYLDSYPIYMSSFATCIDVFQFTKDVTDPTKYAEGQRAASKDCFEDLAALEKSKIAPYAKYARDFKAIINERQAIFDDLENKKINPDKETSSKIAEVSGRYAKISPSRELAKARDAAAFDGELNKLIDLLGKRVNETK